MDVLPSTPVTLWVDFEAPQGLVVPDVGSVKYSLYDGAGAPLTIAQALAPEADATGVSIPILAIHQTIALDRSFERRQVVVTFTAEGCGYQKRLAYRVVELPLHSVVPDDVRAYLGINEDELRDDEVDLFAAGLVLEGLVGKDRLEAALTSGTLAEVRATRAVVLSAAQLLFPGLRYRIAQSKTDGTLKFERLKEAGTFDALVAATADELTGIAVEMGYVGPDVGAIPALQLGIVTTDPVTGVAPATSIGG
ncbi:hypothetical protein [Methylobacterium sp. CG08_land_8_20_14_0_20_71_15]|uniref:Uncharacterized protein n=3 Tax=Pseudomonadota TaxID=1224 RepID=A0ABQ4SY07_9HYPH|nr:hypothetical protein [Methylobacterium sp. CG08_land_8_20_14_0_20_71_15]GBU16877.1 hypothetical protein AwMethylo_10920 [Methylobacterium sp.]GJE07977.1 hypothetical protein AOPFMNJM_3309 [Methylobacterium jeotgali]